MSMDEKDLKKLAEEQSAQIEIPDSLKPEQIERLLEPKGKKKKKVYYQKITALAACGMLAIGLAAAGAGGMFTEKSSKIAMDFVESESSMPDEPMSGAAQSTAEDSLSETQENALEDSKGSAAEDTDSGSSSGQKKGGKENKKAVSGHNFEVTSIKTAKNYDEIYEYISEQQKAYESATESYVMEDMDSGMSAGGAETAKSADMPAAVAEDTAVAEGASDYSDTNVREEGVGEPDIIKTDGKRIYTASNQQVHIVDIQKEEMKYLGTVKLDEEGYISEIFIKDDRLIVVYTQTIFKNPDGEYGGYQEYTVAETFDVSKPEKPKSVGKITQSGAYNNMRVVGDDVYLLSNFYADTYSSRVQRDMYIPSVQGKRVESGDILMPLFPMGNKYTVISAFSIKDPEKKVDNKAVFGSSGICYVSRSNIYICESNYGFYDVMPLARQPEGGNENGSSSVAQTCIRKISYEDGELEAVGQTVVDGILNDSFSIDEYEGNLRLAVTVTQLSSGNSGGLVFPGIQTEEEEGPQDSNSLYILDKNLKELSRIEGLAPDETIYSARFMGETGYFVTFRQIDPLFSVDLSNPKKPEIIGELKIPGFSQYLHPYGEGLLLGIGMDVDETGITTEGVKLSMFDISDPADVEEVQKYILEDTYSTDVSYNYKAAFLDVKKNLIGFSAYGDTACYYIFSYGEDGFECLFERELTGFSSEIRALYSGSRLYLVTGNTVESFDINTFEKIDDIVL